MDSNLQEICHKVVDSVKTTYYLDVFSCKHAFSVKKVPQERVQLESPASVTVHHSIVDANASYMRSHNPLTWTGCTCSVKTRMGWVMWTALACQVAFAHERHHALLVSGEGKRESQVDYQLSAALCVFKALTWLYSLPPETTALGCQWTWIKARCAFHARKAMTWQRRICFEGECWLKLCWMTCCCVHQWLYGILVALAMAKRTVVWPLAMCRNMAMFGHSSSQSMDSLLDLAVFCTVCTLLPRCFQSS